MCFIKKTRISINYTKRLTPDLFRIYEIQLFNDLLLNILYFFVSKLNTDWSCLCSLKPGKFAAIDLVSSII